MKKKKKKRREEENIVQQARYVSTIGAMLLYGRCLLLLLRIRSAHLEIFRFSIPAVLINTGIFLRSLKLGGESRT